MKPKNLFNDNERSFAVAQDDFWQNRPQIRGDVLADFAIATGGTTAELVVFKNDGDAGAVKLGFDAIFQGAAA